MRWTAPKLGQPPPLGWILSEQAKENMQKQITEKHNCLRYRQILERFGGEDDSPECEILEGRD